MLDCQGQLASKHFYLMLVMCTHIQNFHTNPVSHQAKGKPKKLPALFPSELCMVKHGHHIFIPLIAELTPKQPASISYSALETRNPLAH